jgi:hypothetical protein
MGLQLRPQTHGLIGRYIQLEHQCRQKLPVVFGQGVRYDRLALEEFLEDFHEFEPLLKGEVEAGCKPIVLFFSCASLAQNLFSHPL